VERNGIGTAGCLRGRSRFAFFGPTPGAPRGGGAGASTASGMAAKKCDKGGIRHSDVVVVAETVVSPAICNAMALYTSDFRLYTETVVSPAICNAMALYTLDFILRLW